MKAQMPDDRERDRNPPEPEDDEPIPRGRFSRLGEQLSGLLDPEAAFRRGQGIVTGVTQATKDEVIRIVSHETRNFLEKMDAAQLVQQVIAGLVVDVSMQIRFSRDENGRPQPEITKQTTKLRSDGEEIAREREREAASRDDEDGDDDD